MDVVETTSKKCGVSESSKQVISEQSVHANGTNYNGTSNHALKRDDGSTDTSISDDIDYDSLEYEIGISADDPFRYGWRYIQTVADDGSVEYKQIPLTLEDLLHPQEEDFRMQNPKHKKACVYLDAALSKQIAHVPEAIVLHDTLIDLRIPGVKPFGPDIAVIMEADIDPPDKGTLVVGEDCIAPILMIEVTSPTTRKQDFNEKPQYMQQAGLPYYFIVDIARKPDERRVYGCELNSEGYYVGIRPNEQGWVWMEPVNLWLGLRNSEVECYDAQGNLVLKYTELVASLEAETQRADAEAQRADAEAAEKQRLMEYIRSLGIDPSTIPPG